MKSAEGRQRRSTIQQRRSTMKSVGNTWLDSESQKKHQIGRTAGTRTTTREHECSAHCEHSRGGEDRLAIHQQGYQHPNLDAEKDHKLSALTR